MYHEKLFLLVSLMAFLHFSGMAQELRPTDTISIVTKSDMYTIHMIHDVVVIHEPGKYIVEFYINGGENSEKSMGSIHTDKPFDKASYVWETDNKVAIRFIDSRTGNDFNFKLYSYGRSTGMTIEDSEKTKL